MVPGPVLAHHSRATVGTSQADGLRRVLRTLMACLGLIVRWAYKDRTLHEHAAAFVCSAQRAAMLQYVGSYAEGMT